MKATDVLHKDELRLLTHTSDVYGVLSIGTDWALIGACLIAAGLWPHPVVLAGALLIIGSRQLGLAVLSHEAAHRTLFRRRALNDLAGRWLCAAPVWTDVDRYRDHHLRHHGKTGTPGDPDLGLVTPFPITRASLIRKLLRDLTGIAGVRRIVALLLMDLGLLTYTASVGARWAQAHERAALRRRGLPPLLRMLVVNGGLFAVLVLCGQAWLYGLWGLSWLTTYGLVLRIRAIAEHACCAQVDDASRNTRTTRAGWLARLLVAPHHVNYHLEHHLLMTVPHWRLPAMHAVLAQRGVFHRDNSAPGYLSVLRQVIHAP